MTKIIRVAVLVTAHTRPKDLSRLLDLAFQEDPSGDVDDPRAGILQFVVEGHGWPTDGDPTERSLWDALLDDTADRLTEA